MPLQGAADVPMSVGDFLAPEVCAHLLALETQVFPETVGSLQPGASKQQGFVHSSGVTDHP